MIRLPSEENIIEMIEADTGKDKNEIVKKIDSVLSNFGDMIKTRQLGAFRVAQEMGVRIKPSRKTSSDKFFTIGEIDKTNEQFVNFIGYLIKNRGKGKSGYSYMLGDKTGSISFRAWEDNDRIPDGLVSGQAVSLVNVKVYDGNKYRSISTTKHSEVRAANEAPHYTTVFKNPLKDEAIDGDVVVVNGVVLDIDVFGYSACPDHFCKVDSEGYCDRCGEVVNEFTAEFGKLEISDGSAQIRITITPSDMKEIEIDDYFGMTLSVIGKMKIDNEGRESVNSFNIEKIGAEKVKEFSKYFRGEKGDEYLEDFPNDEKQADEKKKDDKPLIERIKEYIGENGKSIDEILGNFPSLDNDMFSMIVETLLSCGYNQDGKNIFLATEKKDDNVKENNADEDVMEQIMRMMTLYKSMDEKTLSEFMIKQFDVDNEKTLSALNQLCEDTLVERDGGKVKLVKG